MNHLLYIPQGSVLLPLRPRFVTSEKYVAYRFNLTSTYQASSCLRTNDAFAHQFVLNRQPFLNKLSTENFNFEKGKIRPNKLLMVSWVGIGEEHLTTKRSWVVTTNVVLPYKFIMKFSVDCLLINYSIEVNPLFMFPSKNILV